MSRGGKKFTAENSAGYAAPAAIAADPVIFTVGPAFGGLQRPKVDDVLQVLMVTRDQPPFQGALQLPGGFVGELESPEQTAARKLEEKTGVDAGYLEQLRTYADPGRDPRGWIPSVAYLALIPHHRLASESAKAHTAVWMPVERLGLAQEVAFDHKQLVNDALERLRGKLWYSNIAMGLLPEEFTLGEAARIYGAIAGHEFNLANFSRDLKSSDLIVATGNTKPTRTRPGRAYRFRSREPEWSPAREKGGRA